MSTFEITLRFDDDDHSLTARNGLAIDDLSELLSHLSKAVPFQSEDKIVLSEIRGNCYALNLATNSIVVHNSLKIVHEKIGLNDYSGLNHYQKNYAKKIKSVLGNNLKLDVYTKDKSFEVKINHIALPKQSEFYFNIVSINGLITSIGSKSLKSKSFIHISSTSFDIEVTRDQERELSKYFKNRKINFIINKKISTENSDVKSAKLESFNVLNDDKFTDILSKIREEISDDIYDNFKDRFFND
jgi:hypothetical protein